MDDRVNRALDGEIPREHLTNAERAEHDAFDATVRETLDTVRSTPSPDLTARVMGAIRDLEADGATDSSSPALALLGWLWQPRPLTLSWRPVYAAALLLLIVASFWTRIQPSSPTVAAEIQMSAPAAIYVQFRLDAPDASSVQLVGSFTDWVEGIELVETIPGVWSTLLPLEPGVHDYTFVIDGGLWVVDPMAPTVEDGFGGSKNRLFLTRPLENA